MHTYKQTPMCLVVDSFSMSLLTFSQAEEIHCLNLESTRPDPGLVRSCAYHHLASVDVYFLSYWNSIVWVILLGTWKDWCKE